MLNCIHDFSRISQEEIEYANTIVPESGEYLGGFWLRKFVQAELTDDEAKKEIANRKLLISRLCELFPSVLRYMKLAEREDAQNVLHIIHDCVSDLQDVASNGRKDANRRKIKAKLKSTCKLIEELIPQLEQANTSSLYDFDRMLSLYQKHVDKTDDVNRSFVELQRDMDFLLDYLDYSIYRIDHDPGFIWVPDNQAKTHIVEYAYRLTTSWDGPPFVTTPGSDFSAMCGLIYEIATGVPDESFAGAISRFARSRERAEEDQHLLDYGPEWERSRDEDNFFDVKEAAVKLQTEIAQLRMTLNDPLLPQKASVLIGVLLSEAMEKAEDNEKRHGPFIMWASQMKVDWSSEVALMDDIHATEVRLAIRLGSLRRAYKNDLDVN